MLKINTVTMKEKIEEILKNCYTNFGEFDESKATKELLNLFDVSCQCDACKQDRIDRDYRKYLELNKNVIGYD